jgi:hypothetical protein
MAVDKLFGVAIRAVGERRLPMRRFTQGGGQIPRYLNVPRNVNEISKLRSSLYTFSVAAGDVTSMIPGKFMPNLRNNALTMARGLGDINALNKTIMKLSGAGSGGAIGERFARRLTGRASGVVVRKIPGDNPASRLLRSRMGAEFQRRQNKLFKQGGKAVSVTGKGKINAGIGNKYMQDRYDEFLFKFATDFVTSVQKYVPIDTGALIKSVQVSNRSISGNENEVAVTMGDNNNVYYAPAVEFGRGAGVSGRQPTGIKNTAGVPQRFENYKGFQPTRAPLRKGAIAVTNKYKGLLKETTGSITTDKIPTFLRQSLKGVFG